MMNLIEYKPTDTYGVLDRSYIKIFLAGSIEQGTAEKWQEQLVEKMKTFESDKSVYVFNPRRDAWSPNWLQDREFEPFYDQVSWELEHIDRSDVVFFWFDGKTKSPITLLELGVALRSEDKEVIVYCPKEFWRFGNVDITSQYFGVHVWETPEQAIDQLKRLLEKKHIRYTLD